MKHVLVVEDEPILRDMMEMMLHELGHSVRCASTQLEAERATEESFDVAIVDLSVLKPEPERLLRRLRALPQRPRVVLCSAASGVRETAQRWACDVLQKPFGFQDFTACMQQILEEVGSPLPLESRALEAHLAESSV